MSDEIEVIKPLLDARGKFAVGNVGGPGRPKGMSLADKMRYLLEPEREKLVGQLLKNAYQSEDVAASNRAIEIALSRIAPPPKQEAEKISVPGLAQAVTFSEKCEAVFLAVSNGEVSAEAGSRVLSMIEVYRKAFHTDDLEREINELKAMQQPITVQIKEQPAIDDGSELV